jgi:DNA repair photolyase
VPLSELMLGHRDLCGKRDQLKYGIRVLRPVSTEMAVTQIEWTDATWNPIAGCSIMSAGCTNCYAMEMARRLDAMGVEKYSIDTP